MKKGLILVLMLVLAGSGFSADLLVPDDHQTIQAAINAANNGDRVIVSRGEYVENIHFKGKIITVASEFIDSDDREDIVNTIIDGRNGNSADTTGATVRFLWAETADSKLIGFTITGGKGGPVALDSDVSGGGIAICGAASPTIEDCIIRNNGTGATLFGGGIYVKGDRNNNNISRATFNRLWVYNNTAATSGGGMWCSAKTKSEADPSNILTFNECIFYKNTATSGGAGGYGAYGNTDATFNKCIFLDNTCGSASRGSNIEHFGNAYIRLNNSIVWGWDGTRPIIHDNSSPGPLFAQYSCIQGDKQYLSAASVNDIQLWDGIVSGDPKWKDVQNMDFQITWANFPGEDNTKSSCIDTGDPDADKDPDGTRADIGPYYFMQGKAFIYGYVLNAEDDEPIADAAISTNLGGRAVTDETGFFRFQTGPGEFTITAKAAGFLDSTAAGEVLLDDSTEVLFGLLYPDFTPSILEVDEELKAGNSMTVDFSIANRGTGKVSYSVEKKAAGNFNVPAWSRIDTLLVGPGLGDKDLQGVVWTGEEYYVSGGSQAGDGNKNYIYVLDREGNEVNRFLQWGTTLNGIYDMAFDGETIWGAEDKYLYGFTLEGEFVDTIVCAYKAIRCVTWDPDREVLWVVGRTSGTKILAYTQDGQLVDSLGTVGLTPTALSYYPGDLDGKPLYITALDAESRMLVYKMNPDAPETTFVAKPADGGKQEGGMICNNFAPQGVWTYIGIGENFGNDRIEIRMVSQDLSWFALDPMDAGVIQAGERVDFELTLDAANLEEGEYLGLYTFTHSAEGGTVDIPVRLMVEAGGPPPTPRDIELTPADSAIFHAFIGEFEELEILIKNVGELPLTIISQSIPEMFVPFELTEGGGGFVLDAGEEHITKIKYSPEMEIESEATFKVISDDPDEQVINIILFGVPEVSVEETNIIPLEFAINSIYPSPFNSSATVRYGLTRQGKTVVGLYDMAGRLVTKLVDGVLPAGYHTAVINGINLPSGVYMIRIAGEEGTLIQKVVLLR